MLRIECHDTDADEEKFKIFTEDDAINILKFMKLHEDECSIAVVHCEAGISRSAAVSKFIADIYHVPFPTSYSVYNKYIYKVLNMVYSRSTYFNSPLNADELPGLKG